MKASLRTNQNSHGDMADSAVRPLEADDSGETTLRDSKVRSPEELREDLLVYLLRVLKDKDFYDSRFAAAAAPCWVSPKQKVRH